MKFPSLGKLWFSRLVWFSFPAAIVAAAIPHLLSGIILESVFPVPTYLAMNVSLPRSTYRAAAKSLESIDPRDGDTKISQAESGLYSGAPTTETIDLLEQGLSHSPSSARGWMLLAELRARDDAKGAGQALALSFRLAANDYWLVGRRSRDAIRVWDVLPASTKREVLAQVRLLWTEPLLHPQIEPLIAEGGAGLFAKAYYSDLDTLRAINRWRAAVRRSSPQPVILNNVR